MTHSASLSRYADAFSVLEVTESNKLKSFLTPPSINSAVEMVPVSDATYKANDNTRA